MDRLTTPISFSESVLAASCASLADIQPVLQRRHRRARFLRLRFQQIRAAGNEVVVAHPDERRLELIGDRGRRRGCGDDVAAADVDFIGQRQRDRSRPTPRVPDRRRA